MNTNSKKTQSQKIKNHLKRGWGIDAEIARQRYGCHSLAQRISEFRKAGMKITRTWRKRYGISFRWYKLAV